MNKILRSTELANCMYPARRANEISRSEDEDHLTKVLLVVAGLSMERDTFVPVTLATKRDIIIAIPNLDLHPVHLGSSERLESFRKRQSSDIERCGVCSQTKLGP